MTGKYRFIGRPRRTKEDRRFIAGRGRYVADIRLPGMKHVALVASPHASARIVSIDTRAALAVDGVQAVLTGEELQRATAAMQHGVHLPAIRWYPLAAGVVRYAGEWVAAVVADDRYIAEDAAELVAVDYEPLPAVVDPEAAFASAERLVHPGRRGDAGRQEVAGLLVLIDDATHSALRLCPVIPLQAYSRLERGATETPPGQEYGK